MAIVVLKEGNGFPGEEGEDRLPVLQVPVLLGDLNDEFALLSLVKRLLFPHYRDQQQTLLAFGSLDALLA